MTVLSADSLEPALSICLATAATTSLFMQMQTMKQWAARKKENLRLERLHREKVF